MQKVTWPLARVIETCLGKDGNIRVVRVKRKSGESKDYSLLKYQIFCQIIQSLLKHLKETTFFENIR